MPLALSHASRNFAMKRAETSTGERTRPVSCESHGRILAVRSTSGFESQDLAECTRLRGHERALFARVDADRLSVLEKQERRQRAARLDAAGAPPVAASRKCGCGGKSRSSASRWSM